MAKLGLIAGAGGLPGELVRACNAAERPVFVLRLLGLADPALANAAPGVDVGLAEWGKMFQALKRQRCERICFVGGVPRPDFANLKPDLRGIAALPRVLAAARKGDDALLRQVMHEFEQEGFVVEGADTVISGLTIGDGPLGRIAPRPTDTADIDQALRVARALGSLDIGQAVVVANGLVLAVEAQEGTDAMLQRCADLPRALRSHAAAAAGVLAKAVKPIQDRRVDLPTIGPATIEAAARAGLVGVAGEAGALLIVDRDQVIQTADDLGLFVFGVPGS
jgi:UDP-2,3-diacylglucosamine hydrolase